MDKIDYQTAKHVATKALDCHVDFSHNGQIVFEMAGERWEFIDKTDAQAIEEIVIIFNMVNYCMWEIINEKILSWSSSNKKNFN